MIEKNSETKMPDLHIQMNFDIEKPIKKCKSSTNSPRTLPESPLDNFKFRSFTRGEFTPTLRNDNESEIHTTSKIKGLEEIGLFSEFYFSKNISNHLEKQPKKRRTIHITDFMGVENKKNLIRSAGGLEAYAHKKHEFQKEAMMREINLKKFFHHKEKKPDFFNTPPRSPTVLPPPSTKKFDSNLRSSNQVLYLNHIMEKCDEAMMLKPPLVLTKSNSPRIQKSESDKKLNKKRRIFINQGV